MPNYFAQTSIASQTGETADYSSNTFAARTDAFMDETMAQDWADEIAAFYLYCSAAGALRGYTSTGSTVKFYSCNGVAPNYPFYETSLPGWPSPGTLDLPLEVALCISYANDSQIGVPRARRRGRIYISGWTEAANTNGRPSSLYPGSLCDGFRDYAEAVNLIGGIEAGVWSRADEVVYPLERCWVDNEWDTMRSRGGKSTERVTRDIDPAV